MFLLEKSVSKVVRRLGCATLVGFASATAATAQITDARAMPASVTVHVSAKGTDRVPDTLFGSFLEPIGDSINNGIAAEILVNRSLEAGLWNHVNLENMFRDTPELIESTNENGLPLPWEPLNKAAGNRFELHVGDAANSWQSLELMGLPEATVGIKQKVYLPTHRELSYKISFYAKAVRGPGEMTLSFRNRESGTVLVSAPVQVAGEGWKKYAVTLQLKPGQVRRLEAIDFGVSVEHNSRVDVDQFSLMPADAVGTLDPDALAMAKAMHITELRFGGNFSSYYHWRDGVGPEDKRLTTENIAWGIPEYNNFGTDEFLDLCDRLGVIPQFNLNMGSGTPQEAAEWVQYIRAHHKGRVLYEIGNELYGKWQTGYPPLAELPARTEAFSKAVRAVAPDAEIIATGNGPFGGTDWNAAQYTTPPGTFDYLSFHYIFPTNRPVDTALSPDAAASAAYAIPYAAGPAIDRMQAQLDTHSDLRGKVHFAVTEWLFNAKGYGERNFTNESPSWMNEGGAVLAAGFLNTLLRHTNEVTVGDMTGLMEFAGIWKRKEQVYAVPAFYAFQMYSVVKGDTVLPVTSDTGTYNVKGGDRPVETLADVPSVDVVATRSADGHFLTLLCVNRSVSADVPTSFDLGSVRAAGEARVRQIRSTSRYERNDEVEPNHVLPLEDTLAVSKGPLTLTLPHESVTVIRVPLQ